MFDFSILADLLYDKIVHLNNDLANFRWYLCVPTSSIICCVVVFPVAVNQRQLARSAKSNTDGHSVCSAIWDWEQTPVQLPLTWYFLLSHDQDDLHTLQSQLDFQCSLDKVSLSLYKTKQDIARVDVLPPSTWEAKSRKWSVCQAQNSLLTWNDLSFKQITIKPSQDHNETNVTRTGLHHLIVNHR